MFGILPILLTPFNEDTSVDWNSLENLVDLYLKSRVDGITCLGEVSETDFLEPEEKRNIIELCVDKFKGKTVVAGVSGNHQQMVKEAIEAQKLGVSAVLVPPAGKTEEEIFRHYLDLDSSISIPSVILDHPSQERPVMSAELIARITSDSERIKFLKIEDTPTVAKMERLRNLTGNDVTIYGASHGRYFYWELLRGARGLMTSSPVPSMHVEIWNSFIKGDLERSEDLFYHSIPVAFFMENIPVKVKKEVMVYLGVFKSSQMRKKGQSISESSIKDLREVIDWTAKYCRSKGI